MVKLFGENSTSRSSPFGAEATANEITSVHSISWTLGKVCFRQYRLRRVVETEFLVHGIRLSISCSIGIGVFPEDGEDGEALLKNADIAMFSAKNSGRGKWQFFTRKMNGRALERLKLESSLRQVLPKNELFLQYQPQLDLSTGRIVGAEALLRWWHPELGLVPPSAFLPVAESLGEIIPIGEWVLKTACAQAKLRADAQSTSSGWVSLLRSRNHLSSLCSPVQPLPITRCNSPPIEANPKPRAADRESVARIPRCSAQCARGRDCSGGGTLA
jgi:hypothetical protein